MFKSIFKAVAVSTVAAFFCVGCGGDDGRDDNGGGGGGGGGSNCSANFKTKKIGTQTWMAENLNCDAGVNLCYSNNPANCEKYGRLYSRETALTICPKGWHLPSEAEWDVLINYAGGDTAGTKLKATSGWNDYEGESGNGTDDYGFSALPGGVCPYSTGAACYGVGTQGNWWTATEGGALDASHNRAIFRTSRGDIIMGSGALLNSYFASVRCVQD